MRPTAAANSALDRNAFEFCCVLKEQSNRRIIETIPLAKCLWTIEPGQEVSLGATKPCGRYGPSLRRDR